MLRRKRRPGHRIRRRAGQFRRDRRRSGPIRRRRAHDRLSGRRRFPAPRPPVLAVVFGQPNRARPVRARVGVPPIGRHSSQTDGRAAAALATRPRRRSRTSKSIFYLNAYDFAMTYAAHMAARMTTIATRQGR